MGAAVAGFCVLGPLLKGGWRGGQRGCQRSHSQVVCVVAAETGVQGSDRGACVEWQ